MSEHLLNCSPHCEHCLRRNAVEKAGNWISGKSSLSYSASSKPIFQRCHIHSLLFLRQRNVRTFSKTPHGIFPGVTRILINKNMYSERMFTTHIFRAVLRVARVRYFLVGAAGAGGVAAKVVRFILRCRVIIKLFDFLFKLQLYESYSHAKNSTETYIWALLIDLFKVLS